ncbi:MAG: YfhO family protein, partial [Mucinivorans sp.]
AIAMTPADKFIKEDTTNYRVANFSVSTFEDATTSYFHRSVGGYHPAKLRRYQDVIEKHLSKQNMAVYDMLNTKYFITSDSVVVNPHAAGNAWFVGSVKMVKNASEELEALSRAKNFNPRVQAIVDERFASALQGVTPALDSTATIALTSYKVNELTYHYTAASAGVALFSEIYFDKGWTAKVDGIEAPYFRADYLLRAMVLPAGIHVVEWSFAAPHFASLLWITRLSSLVLLLGALISIVLQFIPPRNAS